MMLKLSLFTLLCLLLFALPATADSVVEVTIDNYVWVSGSVTQTVNGSFLWDTVSGTLYDASFQTTGPFSILPDPQGVIFTSAGALYNVNFPTLDGNYFQINYSDWSPINALLPVPGTVSLFRQYFVCVTADCLSLAHSGLWWSTGQPGQGELIVSAVPEPSSLLLLCSGCVAVMLRRRRRSS